MFTFWTRQIVAACVILTLTIVGGGVAFWWMTGGAFSVGEAIYFSLITVSTVGFGEPAILNNYPATRLIVAVLIIAGIGTVAFFQSAMTALLVDGLIAKAFRKRRMEQRISTLTNHVIVAGCGRTGKFCAQELHGLGRPFVVIDQNAEALERLSHEAFGGRLNYIVGDATDDHALIAGGVERASGLVAALTDDKDNVFVVLSARNLNPKLRIVAKALELENEAKLIKAGADKLVSPHRIGGFRLVSELVRPKTMEFLDGMQAVGSRNIHIEDVELQSNSPLVGQSLRNSPIRTRTNALIVAVREVNGAFIHNPSADYVLSAGSHLIVVGDQAGVMAMRALAVAEESTL